MPSFEQLRKLLLISGWVMGGIAIYNLIICIIITVVIVKESNDSQTNQFGEAILIILWISFGIQCAIAVCGIQAAKNNNKVLAILFNVGIILIFIGTLVNLSQFAGFEYVINILISIAFLAMIVITCCFTYHPDNKGDNGVQGNYIRA